MAKKAKNEPVIRLDFDTRARKIIEVYELSPDGSQIRTSEGWVASESEGVIVQRGTRSREFMTDDQIQAAIVSEREMLREKKYKLTAGYITAKAYPIKEWLSGDDG